MTLVPVRPPPSSLVLSPHRAGGALALALAATALLAGCLGADGPPEPVETDTVVVPGEWVFEPEVIRVELGTTVTWINEGSHDHTVTFEGEGVSFDVVFEPGERVTYTFEQEGTFDYGCTYHPPDMVGQVQVVEPAGSG